MSKTKEEIIRKHTTTENKGDHFSSFFAYPAAMDEYAKQQVELTSAPLLAKIEELEERDHYNDRVVLDLQQKLLATLPMKQRISELEKERDELKSLVSDMGKHTNEVVCKHNILVEEIESLKKENERLKRLVPDHPKANS